MKLDRLREWRNHRGLTQEELSKASGVTRYSISNYESGKQSARRSTSLKIAEVLGVELEELSTPPKGSASPLLRLSLERRRVLRDLVAAKEIRQSPTGGGSDLRQITEIRRAAIIEGMTKQDFDNWFLSASVGEDTDQLVPEDAGQSTLAEQIATIT